VSIEPSRFEDGAPMLMAGLRRVHGEDAAAHGIPMQWLEFNARRPVPGAVEPAVSYGIHGDWLPRSGLRARQTPDFERYDARFDPATGAGLVEIWFPVETDADAPFTRGPA
jgi:predicted transcriptional regulator YdeE